MVATHAGRAGILSAGIGIVAGLLVYLIVTVIVEAVAHFSFGYLSGAGAQTGLGAGAEALAEPELILH